MRLHEHGEEPFPQGYVRLLHDSPDRDRDLFAAMRALIAVATLDVRAIRMPAPRTKKPFRKRYEKRCSPQSPSVLNVSKDASSVAVSPLSCSSILLLPEPALTCLLSTFSDGGSMASRSDGNTRYGQSGDSNFVFRFKLYSSFIWLSSDMIITKRVIALKRDQKVTEFPFIRRNAHIPRNGRCKACTSTVV